MQNILHKVRPITQQFINGQFVNGRSGRFLDIYNPASDEKICSVQEASNEDVDLAVDSARQAFENGAWSDTRVRARALFKLADLIQRHEEQLTALECLNTGKLYTITKQIEIPMVADNYRFYAGYVDKVKGSVFPINESHFGYTVKEPVGVVGQVIPWNVPLIMQAWKLAPALAAGCTVVMKTAEDTPLSALRVAELINEAGIPKGVVNIISGRGQSVGQYLVQHKGIDKVAFTGSTRVGYKIMQDSHKHNLKRVSMELGGKSPNIITAKADLSKAIPQACSLLYNCGQVCFAGTRTFVHESLYDEFVKGLTHAIKSVKVGDPFDPTSQLGPLNNKKQLVKVLNLIDQGKKQGAQLLTGGERIGNIGNFVQPTIFGNVQDHMTIAREQIFGPVFSILKFKTNQQVVARANNTMYGLGAGVVTQSNDQALWFTKKIRAGTVFVNCYNNLQTCLPFGGFKDSGVGRQQGEQGILQYLETKTVINKHSI